MKKFFNRHHSVAVMIRLISAFWLLLAFSAAAHGQGTINFNGGAGLGSTYYEELGMWFQVVIPPGTNGRDLMGITYGADNAPRNGTPFMRWFRQYNPSDYVQLHLINGSTFGLTSLQLADPNNPSPSAVSISFVGYLAGGLAVTNAFTTPGVGPSSFAAYAFSPAFKSDLVSVDILAPRWAMDNLVFTIPEPAAGSLLALGLLALGCARGLPGSRSSARLEPPPAKIKN